MAIWRYPFSTLTALNSGIFLKFTMCLKFQLTMTLHSATVAKRHMQSIIIPFFAKNSFYNICLLQLKRIGSNVEQLRCGKNFLKKLVHLLGSDRKFLVNYFGDAEGKVTISNQIEKSLTGFSKLFIEHPAID